MTQQTTIRKLAELVNAPVDKLLEQLAEAGMRFDGPDQVVTSTEKMKLLGFLRRTHGKGAKPVEEATEPRKITLNRSRKQELTVGGGKNRATVDVLVRKKVTLVKPSEAGQPQTDERAEILRKLEESRLRNQTEQQALAEADKRRAEELAERLRLESEAARAKAEAARIAALPAEDEEGARKPGHSHGHGHAKPLPSA
ncbi:MAG TPA: translation initiation factor IF-2 associated domain-containing protein, partial [Luteimonas sp.]